MPLLGLSLYSQIVLGLVSILLQQPKALIECKALKSIVVLLLLPVFLLFPHFPSYSTQAQSDKSRAGAKPIIIIRDANDPEIARSSNRVAVLPAIGIAKVYELSSGKNLRTSRIEGAHQVWLSDDGKRLAVAADAGLWIIDVESGKEISLAKVAVPQNGHYVASDLRLIATVVNRPKRSDPGQPAIWLWNMETAKLERTFGDMNHDFDFWKRLSMTPDGRIIAATHADRKQKNRNLTVVWDVKSGRELLRLPFESYWLALSPDGMRVAVCYFVPSGSDLHGEEFILRQDGRLEVELRASLAPPENRVHLRMEIWDIHTGKLLRQIGASYGPKLPRITSGALSTDGTLLATGSLSYVLLWDTQTGRPIAAQLNSKNDSVHKVAFSGDGSLLVVGSMGETVKVWRLGDVLEEASVRPANPR
jgi:WD40 repeat protein